MSEQSDTPRTDAEALKWGPHDGQMNIVIPADFARSLERELSEVTRKLEERGRKDARRGIWQDICTVPNCDDELWFCRGDTVDGPRSPEIDDADYWDWWCYAEPPSLPETELVTATTLPTNEHDCVAAERELEELRGKLEEAQALLVRHADAPMSDWSKSNQAIIDYVRDLATPPEK